LEILFESETIDKNSFQSLYDDCVELEKLLSSSVKTVKAKL